MPDPLFIEAKVPARVPVARPVEPGEPGISLGPRLLSSGLFGRAREIFAANMAELLERAEDPSRMIRMIILEMEETLVELRSTAARSIADLKELRASLVRLDRIATDWTEKAELALSRDRDDLARGALSERHRAEEIAGSLRCEVEQAETLLKGYEADIQALQAKLAEARSRQSAIAGRIEGAVSRARTSELLGGERARAAFAGFDRLERHADFAEARADALAIGGRSAEDIERERRAEAAIDSEIDQMKAAIAARREQEGN